jgi:hypothetical protein
MQLVPAIRTVFAVELFSKLTLVPKLGFSFMC